MSHFTRKFWQVLGLVSLSSGCLAASQPLQEASNAKQAASTTQANTSSQKQEAGQSLSGTFQDIHGKTYKLEDLRGKKVYIKFWASWCSICLAGLKDVDALADESNQGNDVVVLSMVAPEIRNEKPLADFTKWFSGLDYTHLPVLVDQSGDFMKQLGVVAYPTSAFINSKGELVKVQLGHMDRQSVLDQLASMD